MKESGYYPPGAEHDPNAPYNQCDENDPIEINVTISQTLSKTVSIKTSDYIATKWEDVEPDDEGGFFRTGGVEYDFSECDLEEEYKYSHYTIPELLEELKVRVTKEIKNFGEKDYRSRPLKLLLKECEGWIVDETEVIEE